MPIYEYRCNKCKEQFEVIQKFSDPLLSKCPECSGEVTKLISQCTFQLKGTGWYATDYGKKEREIALKAEKPKMGTNSETSPKTNSEEKKCGNTGESHSEASGDSKS
ncbi:MAG: zinc ribbon domain-containing protein [Thermodesulfobacteriota bacterium]|nr:zinc ribbon domain-containing protein [Thermodesulfobacteriota bacterium]